MDTLRKSIHMIHFNKKKKSNILYKKFNNIFFLENDKLDIL